MLKNDIPKNLLDILKSISGNPSEIYDQDEASITKRVLNYRLSKYFNFKTILETHRGQGVSTEIYKYTCPNASIVSCDWFQTDSLSVHSESIEYLDIDPYGHPYEAMECTKDKLTPNSVISITNGEIMQVQRKLKGIHLKTENIGKKCIDWFEKDYIPFVENFYNKVCVCYYIFPTSSRVILMNENKNLDIFSDIPKYMSFIKKYKIEVNNEQLF